MGCGECIHLPEIILNIHVCRPVDHLAGKDHLTLGLQNCLQIDGTRCVTL